MSLNPNIINQDTTCVGNGPVQRVEMGESTQHKWVNRKGHFQTAQANIELGCSGVSKIFFPCCLSHIMGTH